MPDEIINLEDALKALPIDYQTIRALLQHAVLHPILEVRESAIEALSKRYQGMIRKGYAEGSSLMAVMSAPGGEPKTFYVCSLPQKFCDKRPMPIPFDLDEIRQ